MAVWLIVGLTHDYLQSGYQPYSHSAIYPFNHTALLVNSANDHESLIIRLRENINYFSNELKDAGTADFITALMETH